MTAAAAIIAALLAISMLLWIFTAEERSLGDRPLEQPAFAEDDTPRVSTSPRR